MSEQWTCPNCGAKGRGVHGCTEQRLDPKNLGDERAFRPAAPPTQTSAEQPAQLQTVTLEQPQGEGLTPERQIYLMTNMMNEHALTSEEALEVWQELTRVRQQLAACHNAIGEDEASDAETLADGIRLHIQQRDLRITELEQQLAAVLDIFSIPSGKPCTSLADACRVWDEELTKRDGENSELRVRLRAANEAEQQAWKRNAALARRVEELTQQLAEAQRERDDMRLRRDDAYAGELQANRLVTDLESRLAAAQGLVGKMAKVNNGAVIHWVKKLAAALGKG